jgi:hypothetical protein
MKPRSISSLQSVSITTTLLDRFEVAHIFSGTAHGVDDKEQLTPAETRYQEAMEWLTEEAPNRKDKTRVDVYREKGDKYADAVERAAKAYDDALGRIQKDPKNKDSSSTIRDEYSKWVNENHKKLNNLIQAAWMDWVTNGKKDEVESKFAIVDTQSAMAAVEASKVRFFEHWRSVHS